MTSTNLPLGVEHDCHCIVSIVRLNYSRSWKKYATNGKYVVGYEGADSRSGRLAETPDGK